MKTEEIEKQPPCLRVNKPGTPAKVKYLIEIDKTRAAQTKIL